MTQVLPGMLDSDSNSGRMVMTGDLAALFGALAKAQAAYGPIPKTRTVTVRSEKGSYSFDYAPLDVVLGATIPALAANGLAFLQPLYDDGAGYVLRTVLAHSSGARIESVMPVPSTTADGKARLEIQKVGAAITYIRRYSAVAMLGCVADEDDDGAAEGTQAVATRAPMGKTQATPPPAVKQAPAVAKPAVKAAPKHEPRQVEMPAHDPQTGELHETPPSLPGPEPTPPMFASSDAEDRLPAPEERKALFDAIEAKFPNAKDEASLWVRTASGGMLPSQVIRSRNMVLKLTSVLREEST